VGTITIKPQSVLDSRHGLAFVWERGPVGRMTGHLFQAKIPRFVGPQSCTGHCLKRTQSAPETVHLITGYILSYLRAKTAIECTKNEAPNPILCQKQGKTPLRHFGGCFDGC
jgi:hypothetical protein